MSTHFFWFLSRAAGLTAFALALLSVTTGLAISGRVSSKRLRLPWSNDLHRYLSGLTLAFVVLHVGSLAFDTYAPFSLAAMLLPGAAPWRPSAVALGVIALYGLAVIDLTSRFRAKLGARTWRAFHYCSIIVYFGAIAHALTAGPDTSLAWIRYAVIATVVVDLELVIRRASQRKGRRHGNERSGRTSSKSPSNGEPTSTPRVAPTGAAREGAVPARVPHWVGVDLDPSARQFHET